MNVFHGRGFYSIARFGSTIDRAAFRGAGGQASLQWDVRPSISLAESLTSGDIVRQDIEGFPLLHHMVPKGPSVVEVASLEAALPTDIQHTPTSRVCFNECCDITGKLEVIFF